jgi:phage replication initiation protein
MNLPIDDETSVEMPNARVASVGTSTDSTPRAVTRGETHVAEGNTSATAFVDWLGFSVALPFGQRIRWLQDAVETVFRVPRNGWADTGKGWYGYKHRLNLGSFGLLAFGGKAQRGTYHVELNGHACRAIHDWKAARVWGETYAANVTRLDLAHDDLGACTVSVGKALSWLTDGLFTTSGRPPKAELWDDLGSGRGKTLYVGSRGAGKLLRVYEKGKQLGDPLSPWVRAEVELRNKGRVVPWGAVTDAASYFAGAYPVLGFLSTEQIRLRTIQRGGQISYDAMVNTLRRQGERHSA